MTGSLPVLDVAGLTDTGLKRERNEDNYEIRLPDGEKLHEALFLVADGIGGMSGGDIASKVAVEEIPRRYYGYRSLNGTAGSDQLGVLLNSLEETNIHIRDEAERIGLSRIGTTIAGVVLGPNLETVTFNVGDSRVYRIRGGSIEQLTRDQTLAEQQLAEGIITLEQARSTRNSPITAFLGQPSPINAIYQVTPSQLGDVFVLCSDGLWNMVDDDEIHRIIIRYPAQFAVRRLVDMTLKRGAPDNVTVIIARLGRPPRMGPMMAWIAEKLNWS
jgi:serine/threonine protein phosphatase PrpC